MPRSISEQIKQALQQSGPEPIYQATSSSDLPEPGLDKSEHEGIANQGGQLLNQRSQALRKLTDA